MKYPNFSEEKKLWKKGYKIVVGLDEAGRGPLAGPVVVAAVSILDTKYQTLSFTKVSKGRQNIKIRDSKQLSSLQRETIYKTILKDNRLQWGIGKVSEKVIDKINILEATKLAMEKAIVNLNRKLKSESYPFSHDRRKMGITDFLILDGNFKLNINLAQKSIIKGDEKVFSCALASILAKVTRDRIMVSYHKKYPQYRFDLHKGYGTKLHLKRIKQYGSCNIHRKTFRPLNVAKR